VISRPAARLLTGPLAFLVAGLIDVALALRIGAVYLWRSTIRPRWASGKG
jgi:hypothetical protein